MSSQGDFSTEVSANEGQNEKGHRGSDPFRGTYIKCEKILGLLGPSSAGGSSTAAATCARSTAATATAAPRHRGPLRWNYDVADLAEGAVQGRHDLSFDPRQPLSLAKNDLHTSDQLLDSLCHVRPLPPHLGPAPVYDRVISLLLRSRQSDALCSGNRNESQEHRHPRVPGIGGWQTPYPPLA